MPLIFRIKKARTFLMTIPHSDIEALISVLRDAAQHEILPRFRALSADDIATKSAHDDLVTEADTGAERRISEALRAMYPHALVLGEEAISAEPALRAQIPDADLCFITDPVDGTWNFVHGLATYGVILASTRQAHPVFGALYDPGLDDVILATEDGPAEWRRPGHAPAILRISPDPIPGLTGYLPLSLLPQDKKARMAATFADFHRVLNLRCSCHEFRMMAQGHVDFLLSAGLTPWDHAAGALIVARAGGIVRMLDGTEYRADVTDGYLLCARSEKVWADLAHRLRFLLD